jgi:NADH-quinone oxidoreductase subunit L
VTEWFWLTPVFPLAAALLIAVLPGVRPRLVTGIAVGGVAIATALSLAVLVTAAGGVVEAVVRLPWLSLGEYTFALALRLDPLSALMVALVTPVSLPVFVYAAQHMTGDPRYARFFALLSFFVAAKLTLVLADDVVLLFAAWELVGFASYMLIGFWFERPESPPAATKAFLVTRLADAVLLAGILLLVRIVGSGSLGEILSAVEGGQTGGTALTVAALLLFIGAMGKSAQFPLHGWLPDAMAAPTPVSALLHSATMVVAGVYLVARLFPLFAATGLLPMLGWVGAASAMFGALAALGQQNLKRLLAYSTMSQIGLMFVGLAAGSVTAAMLLLTGQAFYKSLLFLGAGSIGHAVGSTDFRPMGGLARRMPVTFATFIVGAVALAGLPVTFAWPVKDAVLGAAWAASPALFTIALVASLLTALYTGRAVVLAFFGPARSAAAERAGEAHGVLLAPKIALAILVVIGTAVASPLLGHPFQSLLRAPVPEVHAATLLALGVAALGLAAAWMAHRKWPGALVWPPLAWLAPAAERGFGFPGLYAGLARGTIVLERRIREFDRAVFEPIAPGLAKAVQSGVRGVRGIDAALFEPLGARIAGRVRRIAAGARRIDAVVFDTATDTLTRGVLTLLRVSRRFDMRRVDAGFDAGGWALVQFGQRLRAMQTGRVYNYFLSIFVWGLGALLLAAAVIIL